MDWRWVISSFFLGLCLGAAVSTFRALRVIRALETRINGRGEGI